MLGGGLSIMRLASERVRLFDMSVETLDLGGFGRTKR
jgi:hypothetical protein